jgi:Ran GTPase-activating protein (RanGAP) involved in mRNA processing and transport
MGAITLANALRMNKSLRKLYMKGNELGNEGVKAICEALLERQSPISALDFGNNRCAALCIM